MKVGMKLGFLADKNSKIAKDAAKEIENTYGAYNLETASESQLSQIGCIVTIGGDGVMLHALHKFMHLNLPFYGMNKGSLGFLLNQYKRDNLLDRIRRARTSIIHPLQMNAINQQGELKQEIAFNEISLLRDTIQSAKIQIYIDDSLMLEELVADGILVSTPAGSTAYNFAVHGPILPIGCNLLALTPISPFRPRRWKGALIPYDRKIELKILDFAKRPVNAVADFKDHDNIVSVTVRERTDINIKLLFDSNDTFNQKVVREQFAS